MIRVLLLIALCACGDDDEPRSSPRPLPRATTRAPTDARVAPDPALVEEARQEVARAEAEQADLVTQSRAAEDALLHARTDDARTAARADLDRLRTQDIESTRRLAAARSKLSLLAHGSR